MQQAPDPRNNTVQCPICGMGYDALNNEFCPGGTEPHTFAEAVEAAERGASGDSFDSESEDVAFSLPDQPGTFAPSTQPTPTPPQDAINDTPGGTQQ